LRVKANSKLLTLLDERGIERFAAIAKHVTFNPGDVILREGERGDTFYLIMIGGVRVSIASGQELARLGQGAFFGEMAMLNSEPRTATVAAIGSVECLMFEKQPVLKVMADYPKAREMLGMVGIERTEALMSIELGDDDLGDDLTIDVDS
jgi:CRP-like cAMP-binding protein